MKKKFASALPALLSVLFLAPHSARADLQTIQRDNNTIWLAAGALDLNYKESSPPPFLPDSERGLIPSGQAGISYMTPGEQLFSLESSLSYGDEKYRGTYFYFPTVPLDSTTRETISETDIRIGQGVPLSQNVVLIPYGEFGYRYWFRSLSAEESERYRNFDALGGLMLDVTPTSRLLLSAFASAGGTLAPRMSTGGNEYQLGHSAMYKFGGKIGYDITPKWQIFGTADYDYFHYDHSGVVDDFAFEPDSNTGETAVRVGIGYHFK